MGKTITITDCNYWIFEMDNGGFVLVYLKDDGKERKASFTSSYDLVQFIARIFGYTFNKLERSLEQSL